MSIPSFASFPELDADTSTPRSGHRKHGVKRKRKEVGHDRTQNDSVAEGPSTVSSSSATGSESKLFYTDRKGDPLNVTFDGINAHSVPKYRRLPGILGFPSKLRENDYRLEDRYIFKANLSKAPKRVIPLEAPRDPGAVDYISVSITAHGSYGQGVPLWDEGDLSSSSRSASPDFSAPLPEFATIESRIRADPHDIAAWQALIFKSAAASPDPKSAAHIKRAVLDRAIHHLPDCPSLLARQARISMSTSPIDETDSLWEAALSRGRGEGRTELWIEWITWVFRAKGIDEGIRATSRALKECQDDPSVLMADLIGVACAILFRAGYAEQAISVYQALSEAYIRSARGDGRNWKTLLEEIEMWWDQELPRLGQADYLTKDIHPISLVEGNQSRPNDDPADPLVAWGAHERHASNTILPPPSGNTDESDPFRVTLFEDIARLLPLRKISSEDFVVAAGDLLGLLGIGVSGRLGPEVGTFNAPGTWLDVWPKEEDRLQNTSMFARNIFHQLRPYMEDEALDRWNELDVAFEYACSGRKGASKHVKDMLLRAPSSLHLWGLYADIEEGSGKADAALKVYQNVLKASTVSTEDAIRLWYKWAALEWKSGSADAVIGILCRSVLGGEGITPVRVLKAKQLFSSRIAMRPSPWLLKSTALLTYLTSARLEETLVALALPPSAGETMHISRVEFMQDLMSNRGASPVTSSALRDLYEESARRYPSNSTILLAFANNESHEKVWGRVHRLNEALLEQTSGCQTLDFWATAVLASTTIHERREWLDRAINDERMCGSSFLWRCYVDLELGQGNVQTAKSLLYRAVLECPWSKDLHLLAFSHTMRGSFKAQELNSWIDVMVERNLRLRIEWAGIPFDDDDDVVEAPQDEPLTEIERAAEERRRLLPY